MQHCWEEEEEQTVEQLQHFATSILEVLQVSPISV